MFSRIKETSAGDAPAMPCNHVTSPHPSVINNVNKKITFGVVVLVIVSLETYGKHDISKM
jgi:hypothetical protein